VVSALCSGLGPVAVRSACVAHSPAEQTRGGVGIVTLRSIVRSRLAVLVRPVGLGPDEAEGRSIDELDLARVYLSTALFEVDPKRITRRLRPWLHGYASQAIPRSIIVDGAWDRCLMPYRPHPEVARRLPADPRRLGRVGRTRSHARRLDRVRSRRYRTTADRTDRMHRIDQVIESVREGGIRPQRDTGPRSEDEIGVYVTRRGVLVWARQGDHRLSIAQLLDQPTVPVIVRGMHVGFWKQEIGGSGAVQPELQRALSRIGVRPRDDGT
jgi:hypothetical protein